jgi:hypothetical protein
LNGDRQTVGKRRQQPEISRHGNVDLDGDFPGGVRNGIWGDGDRCIADGNRGQDLIRQGLGVRYGRARHDRIATGFIGGIGRHMSDNVEPREFDGREEKQHQEGKGKGHLHGRRAPPMAAVWRRGSARMTR